MSSEEGYVKFRAVREPGPAPAEAYVAALNETRAWLWAHHLIGLGPDGIGYGNLSLRLPGTSQFIISATRTGGKALLQAADYVQVTQVDLSANTVWCRGSADASSESMSHAALYAASTAIGAVLHVHHAGLWQHGLYRLPTTAAGASYGTPAMAFGLQEVHASLGCPPAGVILMGGHTDGLMAWGATLPEAQQALSAAFTACAMPL